MFWKMDSPENMRPKAFPRPPAEVSISILGDIHTMEPFSVIMDSLFSSSQMTTGMGSPWISYFIRCHALSHVLRVRGLGRGPVYVQYTGHSLRPQEGFHKMFTGFSVRFQFRGVG